MQIKFKDEQGNIPDEPVKAENIPGHLLIDFFKAQNLIANLMKWPGAQIGKPGEIPGRFVGDPLGSMHSMYVEFPGPCDVTFQTKEQCIEAWKAECPEMFE